MLPATIVDFPAGALTGTARVLATSPTGERLAVVLDRTPFHPVDHGWPDQGADHGTLTAASGEVDVLDCILGATDGRQLRLGEDILVRRGTEGWTFVVAHLLPAAAAVAAGDTVTLRVDPARRRALSFGHTACHVAALALDAALAGRWRKEVPADDLGNPAFDRLANESSLITSYGAVDTYRLGKSLRKKGFVTDGLAGDLDAIAAAANDTLARWVAAGAPVTIDRAGPHLTDLREWVCDLPEGTARIPCGGTHVTTLAAFASIHVALGLDAETLTMTTSAS